MVKWIVEYVCITYQEAEIVNDVSENPRTEAMRLWVSTVEYPKQFCGYLHIMQINLFNNKAI
jgi:hypothetical protein